MSLKVYNGFRMKGLSLKEQKIFFEELKSLLFQAYVEDYSRFLADKIIDFVDRLSVLDFNKEFEELDVNLQLLYRKQFSNNMVLNKARDGILTDVDKLNMLKRLNCSYYSLFEFLVDILEQDMDFAENSIDVFSIDMDFTSEIILFPISNNKTLFLANSDKFYRFVKELLKNKDFCEKYELEQYFYIGSGDKPDELSEEEWRQRYLDWDEALSDSSIASLCGMNVLLMDSEIFRLYLLTKHPLSSSFTILKDSIIKNLPSLESRIKVRTEKIAFQKYWEQYLVDNGLDKNGYKLSLVAGVLDDFREAIEEKDEKVLSLIKDVQSNVSDVLKEVDLELLTKGSVLDWLPNYKIWAIDC